MKAGVASSVVLTALTLSGTAFADHRHVGVYVSFGFSQADYFHDHGLDCGCSVECHYYGGKHHYEHRHRHDHNRYDSRYDRGYRGPYYDNNRYYDGYRYDDDYRDAGREYWHRHYVGRGEYVRCHVVRGAHYFGRY